MLLAPPLAAVIFSAKVLGILLWIGLAVLTVTLLVLMRTRWGQTKPISKCVGLSLFAHVLLGGYAYGTKLVFEVPVGDGGDQVMKVRMVDTGAERIAPTESPRDEARPWDQLASDDNPPLETPTKRPRLTEAPTESEVSLPAAPAKMTPTPSDLALAAEPARPLPEAPSPTAPKPSAPAPSAVEIEMPAPEKRVEAEPIGPATSRPPRISTSDTKTSVEAEPAPKLPSELVDLDRRNDLTEVVGKPGLTIPVTPVSRATDSNDDPAVASDTSAREVPRRSADGDPLPSVYQFRVAPDRLGAAKLHGGNAQTEGAVEAALLWLAANQSADGRWDASRYGSGRETKTFGHDRHGAGAEADTGITGLALLAFLAAGHTHLEGKYRETVQHGLEFLVRSQRADGYLAGHAELFASMYCHGMASLALSEAFAMTGDQRLKPAVEKAVRYTVASQHSGSGGWRYQPAEQGDMSQFGWQVMALKSAELAGVEIPERTRAGMTKFLRSVSSGKHRGLASYRAGEGATRTMTAEGLACRVFLNVDREVATLAEGADFVVEELPQGGKPNLYYWYYGTLALYQLQDSRWELWNAALQAQLLKRQRTDGDFAGSFDTDDLWGGYGGRVYTTAIATLSLEVYYRYLPLFEKAK